MQELGLFNTPRVLLTIPDHLQERIWNSVGNTDVYNLRKDSGEPLLPSMALGQLPPSKLLHKQVDGISAYELRKVHKQKKDLKEAHFEQWQATARYTGTGRPVDAILSPVAPFAAPPHGQNKFVTIIPSKWTVKSYLGSC